jgi:type IV secretory pathway VirB10-like protein
MPGLEPTARAAYAFMGLVAMAARARLVLVFVALPALAVGQSLGDAARKERERRAKLRESGTSAQTVTDEDLAANKGKLANDPKAKPATVEAPTQPDQRAATEPRRPPQKTEPSPNPEAYWRGRVGAARARVEQAEERSLALARAIRFGQAAEDDVTNPTRSIHSIYRMKEAADAAAAELTAAQAALEAVLTEARRAGALPGWLR